MSTFPHAATQDRVIDAVLIISLGVAQAAALAIAAFATRDAFAALHGGTPLEPRTIAALASAGAVAALCLALSRRRAEALGQSYAITLRRALYAQIARLPKARHAERRVGALSLRFVGDLAAARLWFGRGLPDVLTAAVVLPGAVAILAALDSGLARAAIGPLALGLVAMGALAWHLERRHRRLRQRRAGLAIAMIERIAIAPELDVMGRTGRELRALDDRGASLRDLAVARRGRSAGLQAILQTGVALSGLAMLWHASRAGTAPATVAASLSVLALVAMPLAALAAAWDRFCAWRVARAKAALLLAEPTLRRRAQASSDPVTVTLRGAETFTARAGRVTQLTGPDAAQLARSIADLDRNDTVEIRFDGQTTRPRVAYVGDTHIGLHGSLRRAATLMNRRRPDDAHITRTLVAFGLGTLATAPDGLDQRLAAGGTGLSAAQSLRLDLVRAVLGEAQVIVIASLRWQADADRDTLLQTLLSQTQATVIIAQAADRPAAPHPHKAD